MPERPEIRRPKVRFQPLVSENGYIRHLRLSRFGLAPTSNFSVCRRNS
jgi:hypothetical protein